MSKEEIIVDMIVKGGAARGKALLAIRAAKQKKFQEAEALMAECRKDLLEAHEVQTRLIQNELNGVGKQEMDMMLVHGQDHLMDAIVVKDLAAEMIDMFRIIMEEAGG